MCLFSKSPAWEDDIVFANRRHKKHRTRVTETIVERHPKYIPPPRTPTPILRPATPPPKAPSPAPSKKPEAPTPPPPQPIIELVSVEESHRAPSTSAKSRKSRHGSRGGGGEEVYIERERIRERMTPPERKSQEYDTYRYVEAPNPPRREYGEVEERVERRRSRSITYQSNPRSSGRVVERERVVVEDGGRRREYYRKP